MNNWLPYMCYFFSLHACSDSPIKENELKKVEMQIHRLRERLHHDQLDELKKEVKGQGFMIADWEAYSQELELIRKQEKEEDQIKLRIQELEQHQADLINPHL